MTRYNRLKRPGGTYFFTVVTEARRRFLTSELARDCWAQALDETMSNRPFVIEAYCLLPDHMHCIWRLPEEDSDFSTRWSAIKSGFTRLYLARGGDEVTPSRSRRRRRERGIWQRRFWEHAIRDDGDFRRHVEYIHYNPVKHGLAKSPGDWKWSSFEEYVGHGFYEADWGSLEPACSPSIFEVAE